MYGKKNKVDAVEILLIKGNHYAIDCISTSEIASPEYCKKLEKAADYIWKNYSSYVEFSFFRMSSIRNIINFINHDYDIKESLAIRGKEKHISIRYRAYYICNIEVSFVKISLIPNMPNIVNNSL